MSYYKSKEDYFFVEEWQNGIAPWSFPPLENSRMENDSFHFTSSEKVHTCFCNTEFNPLNKWIKSPIARNSSSISCLFKNNVSLVVTKIDTLAFFCACLKIMNNINSINNFASLKKFPCYIRGDYVPQISPFLQQLKKYDPKFRMSEMNRNIDINIKNEFQYFPFQDKKAYDLKSIIFQWVVVNKAMPPWQTVGNNLSLVEETINSHKIKPMLIILDNFSWNGSKIELKKMLARMKKNGTGVIIITNELPPNNFLSDKILDNIIKIQPGRKDLCAPNNITLQFLKMNGLTQKRRYHFFSYDGFKWHEKYEFYDFLRPYVEDMMNKGCSAKEIVFFINYECTFLKRPMTTANLARLKRQWGLRSYKPEKKPRNTKQSKNHKVLDLFSKE